MNKKINLAINGFGRIGRLLFKIAINDKNINIIAINDLGDIDNLIYLLKFDSIQKSIKNILFEKISDDEQYIIINKKKIRVFSTKDIKKLPWKKLKIDVVAECTGVFNSFIKSYAHLETGAKKVVISGPVKEKQDFLIDKNKQGSTILMAINDNEITNFDITANSSCTTNAVALVLDILKKKIGIKYSLLTTIHSYTASQEIVDSPVKSNKKDFRRGRAGAVNIIPTTTGSAKQVGKIIPELKDKFDGIAVRVPVVTGSLADIVFIAEKDTTVQEIHNIFIKAEKEKKYKGFFRTETEQIVSTDIIGDIHTSIVDLNFTRVVGNKLVKIIVWYDNEAGYVYSLLEHIKKILKKY